MILLAKILVVGVVALLVAVAVDECFRGKF